MEIRRRRPMVPVEVENLSYRVNLPEAKPQNILEEIVWQKEKEVELLREAIPLVKLQAQIKEAPPVRDFVAALKMSKRQPALIAEVKKASPSKGVIKEDFEPVNIAKAYQAGGAACLSVLTDAKFFGGSYENLFLIRKNVELPLLCKEFILYPYQIYLARNKGADAVLLIAALLTNTDLQYFLRILEKLQMTALIEVHTIAELDRVLQLEGVKLIGINNRNLETFTVDLQTTSQLLKERQKELEKRNILIVSESGIHCNADLSIVKASGAEAVLIGTSLVKQSDPAQAIINLYEDV